MEAQALASAGPSDPESEAVQSETVPGMWMELSPAQRELRAAFRQFAREQIAPYAGQWERDAAVPRELVDGLIRHRWLGAPVAQSVGGGGMDLVTYGLLTEEIAWACSSVRSLLTVHDMVTLAAHRWGTPEVKEELVPAMAQGQLLGALGLSEPGIGSDAAGVVTKVRQEGEEFVLDGTKKWTTFGQLADVVLTFARNEDGKIGAFLVPTDSPGFSRTPMQDFMGTRASMVAQLHFDGCRIPSRFRVGRIGFGVTHVASTALDHGRYSVAWGGVGIAQACLDASREYAAERVQFDAPLQEHQLIRRLLADMIADTRAARLLCARAGHLRRSADPAAVPETMIAKYFASRAATRSAGNAVQLHGANGLSDDYPVARHWRDSKVLEIIEGSTQIQQLSIPRYPLQEL
ncbi:MAG: acyl-CoA dehydrogenase family protein [Acidobacteriota bacterium]